MKKLFTLALIFIQLYSKATVTQSTYDLKNEDCQNKIETSKTLEIEKLAAMISTITIEVSNEDQVLLESLKTYFLSLKGRTDFDENEAKKMIEIGKNFCENTEKEAVIRSKVCLSTSSIAGKMLQKLQISGKEYGKLGYRLVKEAMKLDQNHKDAFYSYAMMLVGLKKENFFIRNIVESSLNIEIDDEIKFIKPHLERFQLSDRKELKTLYE